MGQQFKWEGPSFSSSSRVWTKVINACIFLALATSLEKLYTWDLKAQEDLIFHLDPQREHRIAFSSIIYRWCFHLSPIPSQSSRAATGLGALCADTQALEQKNKASDLGLNVGSTMQKLIQGQFLNSWVSASSLEKGGQQSCLISHWISVGIK